MHQSGGAETASDRPRAGVLRQSFAAVGVFITAVGGGTLLGLRALLALSTLRFDRDAFFRAMVAFGERSIAIILVTAAFTGMIMVLQGATYVRQLGVYNLVGWYTGFATLREVGPILVGLMFSGRVGASNASELATMAVTEQIDAMRILALDPMRFLVAPRVAAAVLAMAALIVFADMTAIAAGAVFAKGLLGVDPGLFWRSMLLRLSAADFLLGFAKACLFGGIIGVVSTYCGLHARRGSAGVGAAVTAHVTIAAVLLFACDFLFGLLGTAVGP